ncbi:MAG: D-alanyl-D-alanine carboxypeptidase [Devosia sp.]|uniref:serine hydrolase n=1 Tax=Devosia sp. TaxID=1871048 RepID=UPI0026086EA4|nr:serine hydrolase [Devosia sp.]MDB5539180.1 D-alanyl-D-alanine carboxypeptidase [Devosia sp.]
MLSQKHFSQSRDLFARFAAAILLAFAMLLPTVSAADAASVPRKFAGIVIDAKAGKVLYESSADAARYPASVTKVMTLYILFQELDAGNITLKTKFTVSKYAASAVPTKLGIKAGSTITVENAIKAIVTISANDIARVIAENISGSESAFAKRMTSTAKALGMTHTTYRNASGLPDKGQVTTVRDQATLGIAVYQHFPNYYEFFQTKSFSYGKRTYGNHNRLLGSNGVDGIKTGYTNASGFNLLTAARADGHHIVVAGFGFDSSGARDSKVRELVKKYLPKSRSGGYLDVAMIPQPGRKGATVMVASADPVPVMPAPYPTFRLTTATVSVTAKLQPVEAAQQPDDITVASIDGAAPLPSARPADLGFDEAVQAANTLARPTTASVQPQDRPLDVIGAWLSDTFSLGAAPAPLGQTAPSAPLLPPVGIGEEGQPVDLMTSGGIGDTAPDIIADQAAPPPLAVAEASGHPQAVTGGWIVQIGAAPTEGGANSLISDASSKVGTLGGFHPYVERMEKNGQVFFRARFGGFGGREDAAGVCNELKRAKMSCLAMQS